MGRHIFKCQICNLAIKRGKSLACHHAFCHACIQDDYIKNKATDVVICPVKDCQQATALPSRIIADLKDFNENEIIGLLSNLSLIEDINPSNAAGTTSLMAFPKAEESPTITTIAPAFGAVTPPIASTSSMNPQISCSSSISSLASSASQELKSERGTELKKKTSTLQTPEQIAALKKKRALLQWQMSTPDQTTPQSADYNKMTSGRSEQSLLIRSQSEHLSAGNNIIKDNRPKYKSVLKTPEQRAALLRKREQLQRQLSLQAESKPVEPAPPRPKPTGFTTRRSKRRTPRGQTAHQNIMQGGFGAFFIAAKQSEWEFRSRAEGPWGYQDWDHWDGRKWGEIAE